MSANSSLETMRTTAIDRKAVIHLPKKVERNTKIPPLFTKAPIKVLRAPKLLFFQSFSKCCSL